MAVQKLRLNRALTSSDLSELERMLSENVADAQTIRQATENSHGLGLFVRSVIGMDRGAAKEVMGDLVWNQNYTAAQIEFVNLIVDHLTQNGTVDDCGRRDVAILRWLAAQSAPCLSNTATVPNQIAASLGVALRFDFAKLRLIVPIRLTLATVIPLVIGLLVNQLALGAVAAMGAYMCGIADSGDTLPVRARAMVVTSVLLMAMAMAGGAVSENIPVTIALSGVIALFCGFAGVLGPNAGMTGALALAMYMMYAGNPVIEDAVVAQGLAAFAGALLQTALSLAGWPLKRCAGIRGRLADSWRMFAVRANGKAAGLLSAELPVEIVYTATQIRASGTYGPTRRWLTDLLSAAEQLRLPLASIATRRMLIEEAGGHEAEVADLETFSGSVAHFSRGVARALVLPPRKRNVTRELADVRAASEPARQWAPIQVEAITRACQAAAALIEPAFPIGRRGKVRYLLNFGPPDWLALIRRELNWQSAALRHAIRLAIIIPIAWILGELMLSEHQYWVALTVAMVARPGYGVTMGRVLSRTMGTLIGVVLVGIVFLIFGPGPWGMVLIIGIAAYLVYAALPVNYAFCAIFITTVVITLLTLDGDPTMGSVENRALGTVLGGLLVLAASAVGASWTAPGLARSLDRVSTSLHRYVVATFEQQTELRAATEEFINARRQAAAEIEEAALEPKKGPLEPARAERVLSALMISAFIVASSDAQSATQPFGHQIDTVELKGRLEELSARLVAIDEGSVVASAGPIPAMPITDLAFGVGKDPACHAVQRAIRYL